MVPHRRPNQQLTDALRQLDVADHRPCHPKEFLPLLIIITRSQNRLDVIHVVRSQNDRRATFPIEPLDEIPKR